MNRLDAAAKVLVVVMLLAAMSVFMEATILTLIALVLGGAMVVLGSIYSYRPGTVTGVVAVAAGAAASVNLETLLEVRTVLTALLGLMLPLFLLALYTLGTGEDARTAPVKRRPALVALMFCLGCLLSAPLVVGLLSLVLPTMTTRLSGTAETAIVLLVAAVGSVLLTRHTSAKKTVGGTAETSGKGLV